MREIKFRAWSLLDRNYVKLGDQTYMELFMKTPDTRPYIIMQYTGLKDKNGKEIYEGDILDFCYEEYPEDTKSPYEVIFNDGSFCGKPLNKKYDYLRKLNSFELSILSDTIIGNIYNNPELLK